MNQLNPQFLIWLETQVYNSELQIDIDLLEYLLGDGQ